MYAFFIKIINKFQTYSKQFSQSTALGIAAVPLAVGIEDIFQKVLAW